MTKRAYVIYLIAIIFVIFAYITMYHSLIYWPEYKSILSNLTLNYVLVSIGLGAGTGWFAWDRLLAKRNYILRFVGTVLLCLMVVSVWLVIMVVFGGYHLRTL